MTASVSYSLMISGWYPEPKSLDRWIVRHRIGILVGIGVFQEQNPAATHQHGLVARGYRHPPRASTSTSTDVTSRVTGVTCASFQQLGVFWGWVSCGSVTRAPRACDVEESSDVLSECRSARRTAMRSRVAACERFWLAARTRWEVIAATRCAGCPVTWPAAAGVQRLLSRYGSPPGSGQP